MKPKSKLLELNLNAFHKFVKMSLSEKSKILKTKGVLVDIDKEGESATQLYFLSGFFVEEVISRPDNKVLDIIPYKRGYKTEAFVEVVEMVVPKRKLENVA